MATVQVSIVHDLNGQIISINRPGPHVSAVVLVKDGQAVFVTNVDEESISNLMNSHRVDITQRSLVSGY